MQEYGLSVRACYTKIHDCQLDVIVRDTKRANPSCGSKMLIGYLGARDVFLPRRRVRESLSRVDPLAVTARRCKAIKRRVYNVNRPLGLWHFDGHHKLVKWRLVLFMAVWMGSVDSLFFYHVAPTTKLLLCTHFSSKRYKTGDYPQEPDVIRDLEMWMLSNIC